MTSPTADPSSLLLAPAVPPLPFPDRVVETLGFPTRYWETGPADGHPVVLLHGIADSVVSFYRVLPLLGQDVRAIALDMPGFGLTGRPERISPALYLAWLDAALDGLGLGRVTLVGHSLGGLVAMVYAEERPARVAGLSLVASAGLSRDVPPALRLLALPLVGPRIYRTSLEATRWTYQFLVVKPEVIEPHLADWTWQYTSRPGFAGHMIEFCTMAGRPVFGMPRQYQFRDRLARLPVPVQLIWGERDPLFPVRQAVEAKARRPDAGLVILPEVGHIPPLEAPEAMSQAVSRFVARLTA